MERKRLQNDEILTILKLKRSGYSYRQIANETGRSLGTVKTCVHKYRLANSEQAIGITPPGEPKNLYQQALSMARESEASEKIQNTLDDFSARQLIKELYDRGYRIENNGLIVIKRVQVQLSDIINSRP